MSLVTNKSPFRVGKRAQSWGFKTTHKSLAPPKVVSVKATAAVGFSFGVAEPQLVQEPPGTVLCLWAGSAQGPELATQGFCSCGR